MIDTYQAHPHYPRTVRLSRNHKALGIVAAENDETYRAIGALVTQANTATALGNRQTLCDALLQRAAHKWQSEDSFGNVYCHYCGELQPAGREQRHRVDCEHEGALSILEAE